MWNTTLALGYEAGRIRNGSNRSFAHVVFSFGGGSQADGQYQQNEKAKTGHSCN
jgi:hypothetical protein